MKPNFILKVALSACLVGSLGAADAQIHPLHFGLHPLAGGGTSTGTNWYKDYVGARVAVISPSYVSGDKVYTISNDGSGGTGVWSAPITTPIINTQVVMCPTDSQGCLIPVGSMTGKIAMVWRGNCDFTCKAEQAAGAGAVALVILNQHPGEGPVGMGLSTTCTTAPPIPVIMVSNADGIALDGAYYSAPPLTMTLSPWGQNLQRDLGFVPNAVASWHAYAVPANQFLAQPSAVAYRGFDGAFIANFGSSKANNVKVKSVLSFEGAPQHSDSVTFSGPFVGAYSTPADTLGDSVMAMMASNTYTLSGATGVGRYDVTYTISSDSTDQSLADNSYTSSFYLSDSVFSKGRYDFVNKHPLRNTYEAFGTLGNEFVWGPFYFVAKDSQYLSQVQYSIHANATAGTTYYLPGSNDVLIFKWVDGDNGNAHDSILQSGELEMVAMGTKTFNTTTDSSEASLSLNSFMSPSGTAMPNLMLHANTWYYVAVDLTSNNTSNPQFLGIDGQTNPFPRVYGLIANDPKDIDYSSVVLGASADTSVGGNYGPLPATQTSFVNNVDSFHFAGLKGLIPAVAMVMRGTPDTSHLHDAVHNTQALQNKVELFPNPASDVMSVQVQLAQPAAAVTYRIIDGLGRFVSKETHNNVQNETYKLDVSSLPAGVYYMIVATDGKSVVAKKFTVAK